VLCGNGVEVMTAVHDEYTPTPASRHAILNYNPRAHRRPPDGIVITALAQPPDSGGFKYNPPDGGRADTQVTS